MKGTKQFKAKVCLVGEGAVGKMSLIRRYLIDQFDDSYIMTLGAKVTKKEIESPLPERDLRARLELMIWDVMGQPKFRELLEDVYFQGASGILAVADLTRRETLDALVEWIDRVDRITSQAPVVLAVTPGRGPVARRTPAAGPRSRFPSRRVRKVRRPRVGPRRPSRTVSSASCRGPSASWPSDPGRTRLPWSAPSPATVRPQLDAFVNPTGSHREGTCGTPAPGLRRPQRNRPPPVRTIARDSLKGARTSHGSPRVDKREKASARIP